MKPELENLKIKLEDYFIADKENEWLDIEVVNVNRLDIRIVTNKDGEIDEFRETINYNIEEFNSLIDNKSEKLYLGHLDINTVEEAEFFDISKPTRRKYSQISFADMVDIKNNQEKMCNKEEKINNSRIISYYSYKGGVGRTVALIQTAYLLAQSGKKVLLMDLDIEAPSFYNIFKEIIKTDKGLVDYLYEKLYLDNDISLKDIITKINLNLEGEIYLVSAGVNDFKYVKRLDMLKEKRIYENKLIQKLIKEAEELYDVDYTLIDSRTGINRWGALSLIDIADEVILFAYPNRENIEGLKLIIELIEDCKKLTIALSRIDQSPQGSKIAKELFQELGLNQEYIPIYYESGIALAEKYPIEEHLKPYEAISNFILEEENNMMTLEYIKNNKENVEDILKNIKNINFNKVVSSRETKTMERSNWIIVKGDEDSLDFDQIFKEDLDNNILIHDLRENKVTEEVKEFLQSNQANKLSRVSILWAYIIKVINEEDKFKNSNLKGIDDLEGLLYLDYIKYFEKISDQDDLYKVLSYYTEEIGENEPIKINVILDFGDILHLFGEQIEDEETMDILLDLILKTVAIINMKTSICLKLTLNNKYYKEYKIVVDKYNANILNLDWNNLDAKEVIEDIEEITENTVDHIKNDLLEDIYYSLIKKESYSKISKSENAILLDMFDNQVNRKQIFKLYKIGYKKELSNAIYGKRIDPDVYSKLLSKWIYEELSDNNLLNKKQIFKLMKYASEFELEYSNENKKSIIDFSSFKKAMDKISDQ